jgi:hypothetical protein
LTREAVRRAEGAALALTDGAAAFASIFFDTLALRSSGELSVPVQRRSTGPEVTSAPPPAAYSRDDSVSLTGEHAQVLSMGPVCRQLG